MRIEAHDCLGKPIKQDITRLVVYDDLNNPILVALKVSKGICYTGRVGDKEFQDTLKMLGINKIVILDTIESKKINNDINGIN